MYSCDPKRVPVPEGSDVTANSTVNVNFLVKFARATQAIAHV